MSRLRAIEAGAMSTNKTMTTTVDEADAIIAAAAARDDVRVVASPGQMFHPHNRRIRQAVRDGRIGRLVWAITGTAGVGTYHMNEEPDLGQDIPTNVDPTWYYRKPGGGPQYDDGLPPAYANRNPRSGPARHRYVGPGRCRAQLPRQAYPVRYR